MDKASVTVSIAALLASIAALLISAIMSMRQIRTAHRANQVPIVSEIFRFMRSSEVRRMEEVVQAELPNYDPRLGFRQLPEPLRSYAHEVSSNYNAIGYYAMLQVVDEGLAILPLYFRAQANWVVVHPFIYGEWALRNDHNSFMKGYEGLIAKINRTDIEAAMTKAQRLI